MAESSYGIGLGNTWSDEQVRLRGAESLFDAATFRHLDNVGLGPGRRCLELGGGGGSVARYMAECVGAEGSVVVTDLDLELLEGCDLPNIDARVHNVVTDPIDGSFDVIHARLLLEHLPERIPVLAKLVAALRPGGWVVIEDVDLTAYARLPAACQFVIPRRFAATLRRISRASIAMSAPSGMDYEGFARELPRHLVDAGLTDVDAEASSYLATGGSLRAAFFTNSVAELDSTLVANSALTQRELDDFLAAFERPSSMMQSMPLVSAWGRRPA